MEQAPQTKNIVKNQTILFYESVDWQLDIVFLHNSAESTDKQKINLV